MGRGLGASLAGFGDLTAASGAIDFTRPTEKAWEQAFFQKAVHVAFWWGTRVGPPEHSTRESRKLVRPTGVVHCAPEGEQFEGSTFYFGN